MFFWGKKWQCKTENINSCRHFWVADQPQWLVDEVRSHTCTCTDVPARLCCFPAGALGAAGILIHKCSPEAHISRCISSLRNFFHKSNSSRNKPPPHQSSGNICPRSKAPTFQRIRIIRKIYKKNKYSGSIPMYPVRIYGVGPNVCSFHTLPTGFQCPTKREEHGPRSTQSCANSTNFKCRLKLKIHSNETLGH